MNLGYEPQGLKIYLFGESVDMRKQMNGLIALVEGTYHMDPFEKALFLFTNKKKDKIKALKAATTDSFMWLYRSGEWNPESQIILYEYQANRRQEHPEDFLGDFKGYLQTDGYAGYNSVTKREKDPAISVGCWAHARRYFCDALKAIKNWTHYYRTSFQPFSLSSAWLSSPIVSSFSTTNRSAHSGHLREPDSQFSIVLLGMPSSSLIFACVSPANFRASRIVLISDSSVLI